MTVAAAQDEDSVPDTALLRCTADQFIAHDVALLEQEDDHLLLRVDFGLTNAPVETDGDWREFALPSSTAVRTTNRSYASGSATVTVTLASSASLNGRDRASPAADAGALTYASVYRDLVQSTSGGNITMTLAGLRPAWPYAVRLWIHDYGNANNAVFTNRDLTGGAAVSLGAITNSYANPPTNDVMYSVHGIVTSDVSGTVVLLIAAPAAATAARVNGLEVEAADRLYAHGVPGAWLAGHGLAASQSNALADLDGDRMAAWEEFIAGTQPTNRDSVLRMEGLRIDPGSGQLALTWPAATDRLYAVAWASNLLHGFTTLVADGLTAGGHTGAPPPTASDGFYRIQVQRP